MSQRAQQQTEDLSLAEAKQRMENTQEQLRELQEKIHKLEQSKSGREGKDAAGEVETSRVPAESEASAVEDLRREPMMAHLLDSLDAGTDIGHYGRLVFAMIARHFLPEEEMMRWLTKDPDFNESAAHALLRQVEGRDYNPPRRERIVAWQNEQTFPILPNPDDPDCGNVYRNLKFPDSVYEHIQEYQEEKADAGAQE